MNESLSWLVELFEQEDGQDIDSYKPGKHRLYAAWRDGRKLSQRLTARELEAWLSGWFKALEEAERERR